MLQELFGQCDSSPYVVWPTTLISGPLDERAPTAAELAGVIAANRKTVYPHGDGCVRYRVSVSVLDSTYALTEYRPSGKHVHRLLCRKRRVALPAATERLDAQGGSERPLSLHRRPAGRDPKPHVRLLGDRRPALTA